MATKCIYLRSLQDIARSIVKVKGVRRVIYLHIADISCTRGVRESIGLSYRGPCSRVPWQIFSLQLILYFTLTPFSLLLLLLLAFYIFLFLFYINLSPNTVPFFFCFFLLLILLIYLPYFRAVGLFFYF